MCGILLGLLLLGVRTLRIMEHWGLSELELEIVNTREAFYVCAVRWICMYNT